jgi:hypothetical protein
MSLLMIVLAAVMIMRNGPDGTSSEMEDRPRLELTWEGTCRGWPGAKEEVLQVRLEPGFLVLFKEKDGIAYLEFPTKSGHGVKG